MQADTYNLDRQTDRQTDRQIDRQTDRQTDRIILFSFGMI